MHHTRKNQRGGVATMARALRGKSKKTTASRHRSILMPTPAGTFRPLVQRAVVASNVVMANGKKNFKMTKRNMREAEKALRNLEKAEAKSKRKADKAALKALKRAALAALAEVEAEEANELGSLMGKMKV